MVNMPKGTIVRINIVNLTKSSSFFKDGMLPCILSLKRFKNKQKTWYRNGFNVEYVRNNLIKDFDEN
jgi:hypothetical protein